MRISTRTTLLFIITVFLLAGCTRHSTIDQKKSGVSRAENRTGKNPLSSQLTDKDIFGNETTLAVSEEDIQAALEGEAFRVPLNSSVILVQSGSRAPEMAMQQEISKYYTVSTFSGIPDRQKAMSCNKDEKGLPVASENMNWMQALRYIAAKGQQRVIIVYEGALQSGKYDSTLKSTVWSDFKNEKLTDAVSLRYLVRFTLVDVATGEWATWSPVNYEHQVLFSQGAKNDITELQIMQLKQKTYATLVEDLVNRYQ